MDTILFIVPPYVNFDSFVNPAFNDGTMVKKSGKYRNIVTDMPVGLLSLGSYVKKHTSVDIRVIDFNIVLFICYPFPFRVFITFIIQFLYRTY